MKRTPFKRKTGIKRTGAVLKVKKRPTRRISGKKRHSKTDLRKAKDRLWELCKQIIRRRYGNTCFTCGNTGLEGSNYQTGHFIARSTCSTELAYDLHNLRVQDYHCNINLSGNWVIFEERLIAENGQAYVDALKQRNKETKGQPYHLEWFQKKIEEYEKILAEETNFRFNPC